MITEGFSPAHLIDSLSGYTYVLSVVNEFKEFKKQFEQPDLDWFAVPAYERLFNSWFAFHYASIKYQGYDDPSSEEAINFFYLNAINHDTALRKKAVGKEVANINGIKKVANRLSGEFYLAKYTDDSDMERMKDVVRDLYKNFQVV